MISCCIDTLFSELIQHWPYLSNVIIAHAGPSITFDTKHFLTFWQKHFLVKNLWPNFCLNKNFATKFFRLKISNYWFFIWTNSLFKIVFKQLFFTKFDRNFFWKTVFHQYFFTSWRITELIDSDMSDSHFRPTFPTGRVL